MITTPTDSPAVYRPGYAVPKLLMVILGLVILTIGLSQLKTPLFLLLFGQRALAEAADVIKTKTGYPDVVLRDNLQLQAALEPRDRTYVFWNEFRFHTAAGAEITVRAPVGSRLKPLYPLLDDDGLPTTDFVCYSTSHPETVVFPRIISTWFAPGMLTFVGFMATLIGSFLLYWAKRPIELPHLPGGKIASV